MNRISFSINMGYVIVNGYKWIGFIIICLSLLGVIYYSCKRCFTYRLTTKCVLLLDNEKLVYHPDRVTVFWRDIIEVNYTRNRRTRPMDYIILTTKTGETTRLQTLLISGTSTYIYNTIVAYYERDTEWIVSWMNEVRTSDDYTNILPLKNFYR